MNISFHREAPVRDLQILLYVPRSGYLTRRLVDVSQDVIISEHDCDAHDGLEVYEIRNGNEIIEPLVERLVGRYLVDDLKDESTGDVIISKDKLMTEADAKRVCEAGVERTNTFSFTLPFKAWSMR